VAKDDDDLLATPHATNPNRVGSAPLPPDENQNQNPKTPNRDDPEAYATIGCLY
jgi:hypothetical protein